MQVASVLKAGVIAAVVGFAGAASAVPLNGSVAIGGGSYADTGSLAARTSYTPSNTGIAGLNGPPNAVTGNYTGLFVPAQTITFSAFTTTSPTSFSITGTNFTFRSTALTVIQQLDNFADFMFTGTITPASGTGFDTGTATFRASINRNSLGSGFTTNFGGTLASASTSVPEPASMALLGMGLLGMGLARRKKAN